MGDRHMPMSLSCHPPAPKSLHMIHSRTQRHLLDGVIGVDLGRRVSCRFIPFLASHTLPSNAELVLDIKVGDGHHQILHMLGAAMRLDRVERPSGCRLGLTVKKILKLVHICL